jgi:hypothetical protein
VAERTPAEVRAERIASMRKLLSFLVRNPDLPLPSFAFEHCVAGGDDETGVAELQRIAKILGTEVKQSGEHYDVAREFGRARYRAFYVGRTEMKRYNDHMATFHQQREES